MHSDTESDLTLTSSRFILSLYDMRKDETPILQKHGIKPSAQRVAVAQFVLHTDTHPSADEVWAQVRRRFTHISRATVYNTLNLFVKKGLLRRIVLTEGHVVYDPNTEGHHHFIDEVSGQIHDIPWDAILMPEAPELPGFEVREFQVVMRGLRLPK